MPDACHQVFQEGKRHQKRAGPRKGTESQKRFSIGLDPTKIRKAREEARGPRKVRKAKKNQEKAPGAEKIQNARTSLEKAGAEKRHRKLDRKRPRSPERA